MINKWYTIEQYYPKGWIWVHARSPFGWGFIQVVEQTHVMEQTQK